MSKKQKRIFWPVVSVLAIAATVFVFVTAHGNRGTRAVQTENVSPTHVEDISSMPPQGLQARGPAEIVRFKVFDLGLRPFVAHATPGWVAIYLEDRAKSSVGLVIQSESSVPIGQLIRREGRWRDGSRIFLPRGLYKILDASHPTNMATLIVEP